MPGVAWAEPDTSSSPAVSHDAGDSSRGQTPRTHKRIRPTATAESPGSSESSSEGADAGSTPAAKHRSRSGERAEKADNGAAQADTGGRTITRRHEDRDGDTPDEAAAPGAT